MTSVKSFKTTLAATLGSLEGTPTWEQFAKTVDKHKHLYDAYEEGTCAGFCEDMTEVAVVYFPSTMTDQEINEGVDRVFNREYLVVEDENEF